MQTLVLDFDGVLHSYKSGWQGADVANDPPVDGALEFCKEAVKNFDVLVLSARCRSKGGPEAIADWLVKNHFPAGMRVSDDGVKPAAWVTIDDRAIQFTGTFPAIADLKAFKPWNKLSAAESTQGPFGQAGVSPSNTFERKR